MTVVNHRRKNKKPVNERFGKFDNGYGRNYSLSDGEPAPIPKNVSVQRTGRTDFLDKSMHGWGRRSTLADLSIGACIGNDFSSGHRGMAAAVRGAKKFVRTRIRFHENAAAKRLVSIDLHSQGEATTFEERTQDGDNSWTPAGEGSSF